MVWKEGKCLGEHGWECAPGATHSLNIIERCTLARPRAAGWDDQKIGEYLGRSRTTIWREGRRNRARYDGLYRAERAEEAAPDCDQRAALP